MSNPQWLEIPMSRTNFYGPKDVRAIEVRLKLKMHQDWTKQLITRKRFVLPYLARQSRCCPVQDGASVVAPFDSFFRFVSDIWIQGPVVQSVVSLTISLTVLADSIYNILIFFADKMWVAFALQKLLTFFQQKISAYLCITRFKF